MDYLLEPNVAYLILLTGILLGLMALVVPGTGLLEIGALFCLAFTAYAVFNLSFNWWALLILVLSIFPFLYSIQKPKREIYLGLSIVLFVIGSLFLFAGEGWRPAVNPFLALITSVVLAVFLWVVARKSVQAAEAPPVHDLEALPGLIGEAKTRVHKEGSVYVSGEMWSARSDKAIAAGSPIRVIRREGFILVVEKDEQLNNTQNKEN
jgi:membrane-bound serine protease (ClpP class)